MSDFNDYLNKAKDLAEDASEGAKDLAGEVVSKVRELTDDGKKVHGDSFTLKQEPIIMDEPLPDGTYALSFQFTAPHNDIAFSEYAYFVLDGDNLQVIRNE